MRPSSSSSHASAPRIRILAGSAIALGPGKADVLRAIDETGSISAAARQMRMSYRRAWLLVHTMNECFRAPIVEAAKGGTDGGGAGVQRTINTSETGRFAFLQLPLGGPYTVTTRRLGFRAAVRSGYQLTLGSRILVDIALDHVATQLDPVVIAGTLQERRAPIRIRWCSGCRCSTSWASTRRRGSTTTPSTKTLACCRRAATRIKFSSPCATSSNLTSR